MHICNHTSVGSIWNRTTHIHQMLVEIRDVVIESCIAVLSVNSTIQTFSVERAADKMGIWIWNELNLLNIIPKVDTELMQLIGVHYLEVFLSNVALNVSSQQSTFAYPTFIFRW
ncbi:predicted protein [Histoplasma capsulatum G186AR]|uniref:Uncharacterized protein n=1 Tax=Ajellomyces capsulatus (strain G186AR / H82 / ATCC MYA-2454 / RMSCC 2432) TaxID=447093 RepID=C0NXC8_AJECG|nr:uncharacterized protein HCBG_08120 [Histoplasma capsulatum G186AR]EEH03994.1 predicted protein [Histoplasma capsulatum G186AR]